MKINKKIIIIILIILILLIAGYLANRFYFSQNNQVSTEIDMQNITLEELWSFENKSSKVTQAEFEEYQKKVDFAKNVIQANPQVLNPTHWSTIARMKKYVEDYVGAEKIYLYLLFKNPNNYLVCGNLADLYANYLFDYENAAKLYWQAVKNSQHNGQINLMYYKNLADIYADKLTKQRQEFEEKCETALESKLFKDSVDFRTMLADYYQRIGETQKAIQYLEEALVLDPNNSTIQEEIEILKNN